MPRARQSVEQPERLHRRQRIATHHSELRGTPSDKRQRTRTGILTGTLTDPSSQGVYGMAFSRHGTYLAAADYNGNTYL